MEDFLKIVKRADLFNRDLRVRYTMDKSMSAQTFSEFLGFLDVLFLD